MKPYVKSSRPYHSVPGEDVLRFIFEQIDTVPHLEALLQLWNARERTWSAGDLAARLYVDASVARGIIADLKRRELVAESPEGVYSYNSSPERDPMMEGVAEAYRTDLVRISTALHSKASPGVREFARAFQFIGKRKKP